MTRPTTHAILSLVALTLATPTFAQEPIGAASAAIDRIALNAAADIASAQATTAPSISLADIAQSSPSLSVRDNGDDGEDTMVMLSDLLFGFGEATLEPEAIAVLESIAPQFAGVPALEISGHTDAIGDEATNAALGQRRADAVRTWFIENSDLDAQKITAITFGEIAPVASNENADGSDNPDGRALNRRVEFTLPHAETVELASSQ